MNITHIGYDVETVEVDKSTVFVEKPFPNEHAARQAPPGKFDTFRRGKLPGAPAGISVIFGIRNVGGKKVSEIQSLRFDAKLWTPAKAKKWLKDHGFKTGGFEAATGKPKGVKKMSERTTHDVVVHKASIPLMKGESLGAFISEVKMAAASHIRQKFNLDEKKGAIFPIEVFNTKAVFKVIPDFEKPVSNDFHVAMKFTRATEGKFSFSDTLKVTPVMSFIPATNATGITKDAEAPEQELPEGVEKAMGMDSWVVGGLFAGVL
jgi:hypothetical protein